MSLQDVLPARPNLLDSQTRHFLTNKWMRELANENESAALYVFGTCVCVDNQAKAGVSHHERNVSSASWHQQVATARGWRNGENRFGGGAIRHTGEVKLVYSKRGYQTFTLNMFLLLLLDVDFGLCVCFLPFACACLFIRGAVCTRVTAACYRFL